MLDCHEDHHAVGNDSPDAVALTSTGRTPVLPSRHDGGTTLLATPASPRMSRQRIRDTEPEMALRRELHAHGMRYRVGYPVPGNRRRSIDIAFVGVRLAVFVDGCFWHGCPAHATWPKTNAEWWESKIRTNRVRDADTGRLLREHGWACLRLWEHEVATAADRVIEAYLRRRSHVGERGRSDRPATVTASSAIIRSPQDHNRSK